jgi:hypothetical protein
LENDDATADGVKILLKPSWFYTDAMMQWRLSMVKGATTRPKQAHRVSNTCFKLLTRKARRLLACVVDDAVAL